MLLIAAENVEALAAMIPAQYVLMARYGVCMIIAASIYRFAPNHDHLGGGGVDPVDDGLARQRNTFFSLGVGQDGTLQGRASCSASSFRPNSSRSMIPSESSRNRE